MLKLPARIRLHEAPQLWAQLESALKVEAAQVGNAAGTLVQLNAGELSEFDSSALTLLLSASRLCAAQGLSLAVREVPLKLQELARVYGVDELLWPAAGAGQA
ncbi:STAS domain-containing protein [Paucibacter sp. APW11]|uniref:STAS domain-containing protein n=1 Tax=Roseateles aquae TaxID=3077235 RepID=A0ABU3PJ21_9BURK|nr:STAS domain-containing protein [Paucibacter sp. APW11]MDT9002128.1 STAS domain-containing protein [Paucibacter sp. APW11]